MCHSFKLIGSAVCLSASAMLASCCCCDGNACADQYNKPVNTYAPGQEQPLFPLLPNGATQQQKDDAIFKNTRVTAKTFDADGIKINYCEGTYNMDAPGKPTVLVFLHGVGERGSDNKSHLRYGFAEIVSYILAHKDTKVVLLAPQCPATEGWGNNVQRGGDGIIRPESVFANLPKLVRAKMKEFDADPARIYVTGFSMGGHGTVELAGRNPDLFAACVAICCGGTREEAERLKDMPIALYQGDYDETVRTELTRDFFRFLQEAGNTQCSYREYPLIAHNAWDVCYNDYTTLDWLFAQRKK